MSWTDPTDPVSGAVATASYMITNVTDNLRALRSGSLTPSTAGYVLRTNAAGTATEWAGPGKPVVQNVTLNNTGGASAIARTVGCNQIRVTPTGADERIAEISNPVDGLEIVVINIGTANSITWRHDTAVSTAANRIYTPKGALIYLYPYQACTLIYDGTSARWRLIGDMPTAP